MCGIAGFIDLRLQNHEADLRHHAALMNDTLLHRGPDDQGIWVDSSVGITLAQRRLSIVDLSPAGHQPMVSSCGRWIMTYNGETYSNQELRPLLEARGVKFRGHSDTEVMLEACAAFGVKQATKQFIGMFAFALWDREEQVLYVVRDRLGIKPLYWAQTDETFLFASELKALYAYPDFNRQVNSEAVSSYLRYGYVPAPMTIYKGAQKLAPGTILKYRPGESSVELESFWSLEQTVAESRANPSRLNEEEAIAELDALLTDAVGRRMMADVPLGALLSGGIDSSVVVALMQKQSTRPIQTFTIGFSEQGYDEAPYAKAVAKHLGTDHTELYVTAAQAQSVIPKLPQMFDEPFADSSQIPTFLVSELARKSVTVALSGDGGDEIFAGYNRYLLANRLWKYVKYLPCSGLVAKGITNISVAKWDKISHSLPPFLKLDRFGDRMHKLANLLDKKSMEEFYQHFISQWHNPNQLMPNILEPHLPQFNLKSANLKNSIEQMQFIDTLTYLPDDILAKVDRASMAVSLESRVPLLDHRVIAWAWQQPMHYKIKQNKTKWLLRQVLAKYVPPNLTERPKMGFGIPLDSWLRGSLKDWAGDLLHSDSLKDYFEPALIRKAWDQHQTGHYNFQSSLWVILMFQAWREKWDKQ